MKKNRMKNNKKRKVIGTKDLDKKLEERLKILNIIFLSIVIPFSLMTWAAYVFDIPFLRWLFKPIMN